MKDYAKNRALYEFKRHGARQALYNARVSCQLFEKNSSQWEFWNEVRQWLTPAKEELQSSKGLVAGWYSQIPNEDKKVG